MKRSALSRHPLNICLAAVIASFGLIMPAARADEIWMADGKMVQWLENKGDTAVFKMNNVYFYIHGEDEFIDITVVDATGNLYINCVEEIPSSRKVEVNFGDFYKGVYVVRLKGKTVDKRIKIIKE